MVLVFTKEENSIFRFASVGEWTLQQSSGYNKIGTFFFLLNNNFIRKIVLLSITVFNKSHCDDGKESNVLLIFSMIYG